MFPLESTRYHKPLVIAHRGASGYLPEHSKQAYLLGIEQGADYIEPDLVCSKDGLLIARHEPALSHSTNVADIPAFKDRKRTVNIDGIEITDWFTFDFTLDELKQLKTRQRYPDRHQVDDEEYKILTLEEIIKLAREQSIIHNRPIGVCPEVKHSSFHKSIGIDINELLLSILKSHNLTGSENAFIIQSFEPSTLQFFKNHTQLTLIQLIDACSIDSQGKPVLAKPFIRPYDLELKNDPTTFIDMITPEGLDHISTYAHGIGIWKNYLVTSTKEKKYEKIIDFNLINQIKNRKLLLHVFTFRNEERFRLPLFSNPEEEYKFFYSLGVDAIFSDYPDAAIDVREKSFSPDALLSKPG